MPASHRPARLPRSRSARLGLAVAVMCSLAACGSSGSPVAAGAPSTAAGPAASPSVTGSATPLAPSDAATGGTPSGTTPAGPAPSLTRTAGSNAASSQAAALSTTLSAQPSVPPPVTYSDAADGSTATVRQGQLVHVVLGAADRAGSTYWQFGALAGPLQPSGAVRTVPGSRVGPCRLPGSGCGTVILTAVAAARGTTTVTASRTTCGEAMRCSAAQSSFRLVVHVV